MGSFQLNEAAIARLESELREQNKRQPWRAEQLDGAEGDYPDDLAVPREVKAFANDRWPVAATPVPSSPPAPISEPSHNVRTMLYGLVALLIAAPIAYQTLKPGLLWTSKPLLAMESVPADKTEVSETTSISLSRFDAMTQRALPAPNEASSQGAAPAVPLMPADLPTRLDVSPAPTEVVETRKLDPDDIELLMERGRQFVAFGDLASARLVFQRAAEAGDAAAALAIGSTYDSTVLAKFGMRGVTADSAKARAWYERAKAFGSPEAGRRLEILAKQ